MCALRREPLYLSSPFLHHLQKKKVTLHQVKEALKYAEDYIHPYHVEDGWQVEIDMLGKEGEKQNTTILIS